MIWFYQRANQSAHLETRYDNATLEYVGVVHWPDGRHETERFTDAESFRVQLLEWEARLEVERWTRTGPPVLVPEGWPRKRPT